MDHHSNVLLRYHLASSKELDKGEIHGNLMVISWVLLANVGLWAHFFKYNKWAIPLHIFCMSLLTVLSWVSGFMALIEFGLQSMTKLHVGLGITILILLTLVAAGGLLCYIL